MQLFYAAVENRTIHIMHYVREELVYISSSLANQSMFIFHTHNLEWNFVILQCERSKYKKFTVVVNATLSS